MECVTACVTADSWRRPCDIVWYTSVCESNLSGWCTIIQYITSVYITSGLVSTFRTFMASRGCVNAPDSFCYICGEFVVKKQQRKITEFVEKVKTSKKLAFLSRQYYFYNVPESCKITLKIIKSLINVSIIYQISHKTGFSPHKECLTYFIKKLIYYSNVNLTFNYF